MTLSGISCYSSQQMDTRLKAHRDTRARRETRNEKLDLRLTPTAKRALQIAAIAAQRSLSEFVLESALARAQETLPDRQHFRLNAEQWEAFQAALAAPPTPSTRLARLLKEPSLLERGSNE